MVVKAGVNDHEVAAMARYFKDTPHILRFIEYMDVGASNGWKLDEVIPSAQIVQRIQDAGMPLKAMAANYTGKPQNAGSIWEARAKSASFPA
jgi:cyclic pyranopterin phosphate synthase